jgi:hypothetical protein
MIAMNNIPVVSNDTDAPLILGLFNDTKFKTIMKCEWEWIWKVTVSDGNVEVLVYFLQAKHKDIPPEE